MKIAIDLDEPVVHYIKGFVKFYNTAYGGNLKAEDFKEFDIHKTLGVSKEESKELRRKYSNSKFFEEMEFLEGAKEVIDNLSKKNKIIFITARDSFYHDKTKAFIKANFPYADLLFSGDYHGNNKKKDELCKDFVVDILIEDSELSGNYVESGIKIILIDKPWNKHVLHKNLIRVNNWNEIAGKLRKI